VNIPDYISPIVAYRVWQWDAVGLKSLNNEPWLPEHCLAAACRGYGGWKAANGEAAPLDGHEPPHHDCSCGVYAAKNFAHLRNIGYADYGVHGEVYLWGTVVEHRLGYRAQYAYPKSLVLPAETIPFRMSAVKSRLETLMAYGADIFIPGKAGNIPLWSKASGLRPGRARQAGRAAEEVVRTPRTGAHPQSRRPRGGAWQGHRRGCICRQ